MLCAIAKGLFIKMYIHEQYISCLVVVNVFIMKKHILKGSERFYPLYYTETCPHDYINMFLIYMEYGPEVIL